MLQPDGVIESFATIGLYVPLPQLGLLGGEALKTAITFLPMIVAYVFSDLTAALQWIEQAEQSGEFFDHRTCLLAIGGVNLIGSFLGNPFPMNCYWGHPAWKKAKAGTAYPVCVGVIYLVLCMSGLVAIATSAIPAAATLIMLIFVAISTGTQSYSVVQKKYYPAMIVATALPIMEMVWGKIENGAQAGVSAAAAALEKAGVNFDLSSVVASQEQLSATGISSGYFALGKGSMMIAILFACIMIFVIDRKWKSAAVTSVITAGCAFMGLIHSAEVKWNAAPTFAAIYLGMGVFFVIVYLLSKKNTDLQPEIEVAAEE